MIENAVKHFMTINEHKRYVFWLCLRCGLVWQGITHDLSKFTPTEFFEAVKYYHGDKSPNSYCMKEKGFSEAWLHHKGHNKHHHEYWYDYKAPDKTPMMPYQYIVELICDNIAASLTYNKKNWDKGFQYIYWTKRSDSFMINDRVKGMVTEAFKEVSEDGIDPVITKKHMKELYNKYCENK